MRLHWFAATALLLATGCSKIAARDLIRAGNAHYEAGRYEEAIAAYDKSLEYEPDGVTVLWNRACAAESLVLALREATHENQLESRRKWASRALEDFQTWYDRLEVKTEADTKALREHRLALLKSDNRCDDLVALHIEEHKANPKDEQIYGVLAKVYDDICGDPAKAEEWMIKRTVDFPDSEKGWYALAVRRLQRLFPDGSSDLPYNEAIPPEERIAVANDAIALLEKATAIRDKYRDPYIYRAVAYTQRQFARVYDESMSTLEDKRQALLAREDSYRAWQEQKGVCDIDKLPDCALVVELGELPWRRAELAAGAELLVTGKVDPESVQRGAVDPEGAWVEYKLVLTAPAVPDPARPPDPAPARGAAPPEPLAPVRLAVMYRLEADVARAEQLDATEARLLERWREGRSLEVAGRLQGGEPGSLEGTTLVGGALKPIACCPAPPFTDRELAADRQRLREIEAQIVAEREAAQAGAAGTKPPRRGGKGR